MALKCLRTSAFFTAGASCYCRSHQEALLPPPSQGRASGWRHTSHLANFVIAGGVADVKTDLLGCGVGPFGGQEKKGKFHITHGEEGQDIHHFCSGKVCFLPSVLPTLPLLLLQWGGEQQASHPHLLAGNRRQQGRALLKKQELNVSLGGLKSRDGL